eukprot:535254-Pyramimonas_sp.AAC.1
MCIRDRPNRRLGAIAADCEARAFGALVGNRPMDLNPLPRWSFDLNPPPASLSPAGGSNR